MPAVVDNLEQRRDALIAASLVLLACTLFGPLTWPWAVAGMLTLAAWAMLWPRSPRRHAVTDGGNAASAGSPTENAAFRAIVDGIPDAALMLQANSIVTSANSAAHAMAPVETGRPLSHWCRSPDLFSAIEAAIESGTPQRRMIRWFTPFGRYLDVLVSPLPITGDATARTLLIVLRDLTEQDQTARMRADFVANASHELRTPLASIKGFIETLQGAAKDDPDARSRFLGIMDEQAERMSRLISDLLSLSRIEMREHVPPGDPVDLAGLVTETCRMLDAMAGQAGIALEANCQSDCPPVAGDREELAQVTQNLAQNAIKYGRRGGFVRVSVTHDQAGVVLQVADNGIGIAAEHLPRLTERFYRVSAKQSRDRGGTGLGLAIVKHIVNRHRGTLRIDSVEGEGSRFVVTLPVHVAAVNGSSPARLS